jgi:TolB-like protein
MLKVIRLSAISSLLLFAISGCTQIQFSNISITTMPQVNTNHLINNTVNATITDLAKQLKKSAKLKKGDKGSIAVTTFVDLNLLEKTTYFGRSLAESMFNELFIRGFNVSDFRGKNAISINSKGEFYITRDIKNIKSQEISNTYVLVGTYTKIGRNILINVRIIDNNSGNLVASARSIYKNDYCKLNPEFCTNTSPLTTRKIRIVTDEPQKLMLISGK